jgi:DNA-binding NarL/FixJ family response regulator
MLTGANMTADISRIRTMVVDDSPKFLRTVCSFLSQFKAVDVVATANNAGEALRAVDQLRPDLVLLDFHMPLVNGLETMELIRRRSPATRVVIITGYDSAELREASLESGALAFIPKLYVSRELPHLLAQIAASIGSEQIH